MCQQLKFMMLKNRSMIKKDENFFRSIYLILHLTSYIMPSILIDLLVNDLNLMPFFSQFGNLI